MLLILITEKGKKKGTRPTERSLTKGEGSPHPPSAGEGGKGRAVPANRANGGGKKGGIWGTFPTLLSSQDRGGGGKAFADLEKKPLPILGNKRR